MTVIEEYTKELILDFTWINPNPDYILTDYYWQKFRKSVNTEFTTKKGSRKRYYSERVYTQFCLWLIDLDISRARNPRRKILADIKEKLNEQKDELLSIGCAQDVFNASVERTDSVDIALTQVQKYVDLVTGGGIEKAREEAEKERAREREKEKVRLRENLDNELRKYDQKLAEGLITEEQCKAFKRELIYQSVYGMEEAAKRLADEALKEKEEMLQRAVEATKEERIKLELDKHSLLDYKSGHMTAPIVYIKEDSNRTWKNMTAWKFGYTTNLEQREYNSTTDNPTLQLIALRQFETPAEAVGFELQLKEEFKDRNMKKLCREFRDNKCEEFFFLSKKQKQDLLRKYNWKASLN